MAGGKNQMRRRRYFFKILLLGMVVLLGRVEFSFSREPVRQFTMNNALKGILEENKTTPVVALQVWIKVGSADENDQEAGMCHFLEHMLFKGTEKRKVREAAREIESLGGTINAYTSYDQTVYHITMASRYAETGLDILSDAIQHSTFESIELERDQGGYSNRPWPPFITSILTGGPSSGMKRPSGPSKEPRWSPFSKNGMCRTAWSSSL